MGAASVRLAFILFGIICNGFLWPCAVCADPTTVDFEPHYSRYLESGNAWTFLYNGSTQITETVLSGTHNFGGRATKALRTDGGEFDGTLEYIGQDDAGYYEHGDFSPDVFIDGLGFVDITSMFEPPVKVDKTAVLGDLVTRQGTITFQYSGYGSYDLQYTATLRITGPEQVNVPLGTFEALKSEESLLAEGTIEGEPVSITVTSTTWTAANIGLIKSVVADESLELVDVNFRTGPTADAGDDEIVFDEITLDGSQSHDDQGEIVSYEWQVRHRENSAYDRAATGQTAAMADLEKGFYDVTLVVTNDAGLFDMDNMTFSAIGMSIDDIQAGMYTQEELDQAVADAEAAKDQIIAEKDATISAMSDLDGDGKLDFRDILWGLEVLGGKR